MKLAELRNTSPVLSGARTSNVTPMSVREASDALKLALNQEKTHKLKSLVSVLVEMRRKHEMNDEVFAEVLELTLATYVEHEVNLRLEEALAPQLKKILNVASF